MSTERVTDWATDYDILDPAYVTDPGPIWSDLRQRCPMARTERWGGSWLPTRYDDVHTLARMVPELSSRDMTVIPPPPPGSVEGMPDDLPYPPKAPPISSDPPEHGPARKLILTALAPPAVAAHEASTKELADRLIDGFLGAGRCDGATDYAQQIPPRVICSLLGLEEAYVDQFVAWTRGLLEQGLTDPRLRLETRLALRRFFFDVVAQRRDRPGTDFISEILAGDLDGEPVSDEHAVSTCILLMVAGIDTTWSSIGSALWHLAVTPADRERLVAEPGLLPVAIEELLRFYSPVTMARVATTDVEVAGAKVRAGDRVLVNFPAANRDPTQFPDADLVVIDRAVNRHVAFGVGIHRCAGSNLARMEMQVALSAFLDRIPNFSLADPAAVTWAGGQVRGPRALPLAFG